MARLLDAYLVAYEWAATVIDVDGDVWTGTRDLIRATAARQRLLELADGLAQGARTKALVDGVAPPDMPRLAEVLALTEATHALFGAAPSDEPDVDRGGEAEGLVQSRSPG